MKIYSVVSLIIALLFAAGCKRSEPAPTPAPPPPPPAATAAPLLPAGHPPIDMSAQQLPPGAGADAANPQWTMPKDWQPGRPSSMRRASFVIMGPDTQSADIAVTAFPGDVGGMLMNINRWRGQIGLGPVTEDQVAGITSKLTVNGIEATVVDFTADKAKPVRMLVATIPHKGVSWFFKITGDASLVEAQKETFLAFVQSVKF
jgi:hypothetical protein